MYSALLVAPDGDWVTDYHAETVAEIQELLCDQGSRWYFYPFHAVIRDHAITRKTLRIIDAAYPFEHLRGKSIGTFTDHIAAMPEAQLEAILAS